METKLFIDGINVTLSSIKARVSDYTVYNNKIWRIVASEGAGLKYKMKLEREKVNQREEIWLSPNVGLYKVVEPTGYIRL